MASKGWSWGLLVLPIIAVLVAAVVSLYGAGTLDVTDLGDNVRVFHVVLVGLAVFVLVLVVELIVLVRSFGEPAERDEDLEEAAEGEPAPEEPPAAESPASAWAGTEGPDLEALHTADEMEGRQVIEVARPPKTAVGGGIYASTYVPVNQKFVLRLEELVAFQPHV